MINLIGKAMEDQTLTMATRILIIKASMEVQILMGVTAKVHIMVTTMTLTITIMQMQATTTKIITELLRITSIIRGINNRMDIRGIQLL